LRFDVAATQISFHEPTLPLFLQSLVISGLSIGAARVDIGFDRMDNQVGVKTMRREGVARIVTVA